VFTTANYQLNAIHSCPLFKNSNSTVLFPIHTGVFAVARSLLVVLNAVFSKLINWTGEVATAVRDKHINEEGVGTCE
jgi:hypothetical protein